LHKIELIAEYFLEYLNK